MSIPLQSRIVEFHMSVYRRVYKFIHILVFELAIRCDWKLRETGEDKNDHLRIGVGCVGVA